MSNTLILPNKKLPKPYKEARKKVNQWLSELNQMQDDEKYEIDANSIPYFFLLTEEHINLPDMTLEELKMVFPYYFHAITKPLTYFNWTAFPADEMKKIVRLSQTKRIPIILGKLYEEQKFGMSSYGENLKQSLESLVEQEDPAVIESYMPLILEAGVFPGVDLKQWNIQSWDQLVKLWEHFDKIMYQLDRRVDCYSVAGKERKSTFDHFTYRGNIVEIDWNIIEFLRIHLLEWENRIPMSAEEEKAMDSLTVFATTRQWTDADVDNLSLFFEGDLSKTIEFLDRNRNGKDTVIFDKQSLHKVWHLAKHCTKAVFDKEENGKLLNHFMKIEAQETKKTAFWFQTILRDGGIYRVQDGDVTVTMHLNVERFLEEFSLKELRVEGMTEPLEIIICEGNKEYRAILSYEDIREEIKFQNYSKIIIKGEREIAIDIPHIVSIDKDSLDHKDAFEHVNLKTLEIRGTVENVSCHNKSVEEIRVLSDMKYMDFQGCTNLKKAVLPHLDLDRRFCGFYSDTQINVGCIPYIFKGCTNLVSVIGPNQEELLVPSMDGLCDKEENLPLDEWNGRKIIYQKDFLWWPKIMESEAEILIYDAGESVVSDEDFEYGNWEFGLEPVITCDNLKEIRIQEGEKILGREFSRCHNLRKITLPDSLLEISYKAFEECPLLENIQLPPNAAIVRDRAYYGTEPLDTSIFSKIIIPENHAFYRMRDSILYSEAMLYDEKYIAVEWTQEDLEGKIVIPEGVKRICDLAFHHCEKMTEVVLPVSLRYIEKGAFAGCSSLKKVVVKDRNLIIYDKDMNLPKEPEDYEEHRYDGEYSDDSMLFRNAPELIFSPEVEVEYTDSPTGTAENKNF